MDYEELHDEAMQNDFESTFDEQPLAQLDPDKIIAFTKALKSLCKQFDTDFAEHVEESKHGTTFDFILEAFQERLDYVDKIDMDDFSIFVKVGVKAWDKDNA